MPGPLAGVKVLEFSEIIAGPFAGLLLSDMGADVIKIEPPWGEPWRHSQEFVPNESVTYISMNRGKRSLPLDLTKPGARDVVHKLVVTADVVIVNFRPDVPRNLGIDYETLSKINPRLIYCDNTAFGRRGPDSHRPGYDIVTQAVSGLMAAENKVDRQVPQQIESTALADFAAGLSMAWGISAALYDRERSGEGQRIEATLLGGAMAFQTMRLTQVAAADEGPKAELMQSLAQMRHGGAPYSELLERYHELNSRVLLSIYYRTYQTKDGVLAVGCLSDPLRKRLLEVLGLKDTRFEPDYDPASEEAQIAAERLMDEAEAIFKQKTLDEWMSELDRAGVPAGPVRFVEELLDDEQVAANDMLVDLEHSLVGSIRTFGPLLRMSRTPLEAHGASPALGEHTSDILAELGCSSDEIKRLRDEGVTL